MKQAADSSRINPFEQRRFFSPIVLILNIILLAFAALSYGRYAAVYQERLREENLGNIANMNQSSAMNATALIESWNIKLEDLVQFAEYHEMSHDEALSMIEQSNSSEDRQFELIGGNYKGYLARRDESGAYIPLSYQKGAYSELQKAFDDINDDAYNDICFAPEFTDGNTALKYFAVYRHLSLKDEDGKAKTYTLLLATESSDVLATFNSQNDFEGQSTVLIDADGNYIVSSKDFKSANFFQYLYVYNDLSLDERKEIENQVLSRGSGELYFKDASGRDCVFRYEKMTTNNWYCVTCVPLSSFRNPVVSINYAIYASAAFLIMLILDLAWLQHMNNRLRMSVQREKEASEAKSDFLSRMSHDIRTPLNGIIGLTMLAKDEPDQQRVQEYLDKVKLSGQFLSGLVNDILDLSKVESGKVELHLEPYSCEDLYRYVEAVVEPLCMDKGLELRMSEPDDLPPILLDRLRFNQIIFNLLSNAVKYTPEGGLVELCWKRTELGRNRVALDLTVRDNGIGMSGDFQKRMFESFSQEQHQTATTGSGLGLAIVHSLINLMNGEISVESEQGEGTAFTVHLETELCSEEAVSAPEREGIRLEGKHILLCEDNKVNVMVARRLLEKWGVSVDTADNGRIGVDKFAASRPGDYDAILTDIMMPEMDGLEAAMAIRKLDRSDAETVPIIAMTANAYDSDVENCLAAGMNAHMGKPIDTEQLRALLSSLMRSDENQ